jgi:hypothetical protein
VLSSICVRCGLKSASHSTCDGNAALNKACSQCKRLNLVCFFRPDGLGKKRKEKQANSVGNIFKADFIKDIAGGRAGSSGSRKGSLISMYYRF